MTEDEEQELLMHVREMRVYWYVPPMTGHKPRKDQLDEWLNMMRTARNVSRFIIWTFGGLTAVMVLLSQAKGLFMK